MATADEYAAWIVKNADKRGTPDFETVAAAYKAARGGASAAPAGPAPNGLSDSDGENFVAGIGQGMTTLARGAGQLARKGLEVFDPPKKTLSSLISGKTAPNLADRLGLPTQEDIDEAKRLDSALLSTKAGIGGSIVGQAVPSLLAAPIGGPGLLAGARAGAVLGGLQPVASDESRATNALVGAIGGGVAPILARGAMAGIGAVRGAVEPFTAGGRQAIAGRTLRRFGLTDADVAGLSGTPTVTGARTTLAEQVARPEGAAGAARLQDAVRAMDPEIAGRMVGRETENNAARVNLLERLAGRDGARDFAVAERSGTAGPMYDEAFRVDPGSLNLNPTQTREIQTLMRAPAIRSAVRDARTNASNAGSNVGAANASGSVEGLHGVKLALDAAIERASSPTNPAGAATLDGLQSAQRRLVGFIESVSPEYASARGVYRDMSRPINQMDVAGHVLDRGTSATSDLAGNQRLMPNALARVMNDEPALIRRATGRSGLGNSLDDLLEPGQVAPLRAVAGEVDRAAAVARAGNGPGSGTAQRLASSNLLHQIGVPENMTDNALVQTLLRPVQFGARLAEPRIQQTLLDIVLDPSLAAEAMRRATPAQRIELQRLISNPLIAQAVRSTAPVAALGAGKGGQ